MVDVQFIVGLGEDLSQKSRTIESGTIALGSGRSIDHMAEVDVGPSSVTSTTTSRLGASGPTTALFQAAFIRSVLYIISTAFPNR